MPKRISKMIVKPMEKQTISDALGRHPIHPFPARMAPGLALRIIGAHQEQITVLDPMMGSGTVVALARARGHRAIGFDIDPLAVLMSSVWTTSVDVAAVRAKARKVLQQARALFRQLPMREAYPTEADDETRRFVRYWFDPHSRKQLATLARAIARVKDRSVRDTLWCGFSRLIIAKQAGASLAMDLSHSRPHKTFGRAPIKPFDKFTEAVDRVLANCIDHNTPNRGPQAKTLQGDARHLPVPSGTVDLVLTSPPISMRSTTFDAANFLWFGWDTAFPSFA